MVDEAEEAVCFGCLDELGRDLLDAAGEVLQGDLGDGPVDVLCRSHRDSYTKQSKLELELELNGNGHN